MLQKTIVSTKARWHVIFMSELDKPARRQKRSCPIMRNAENPRMTKEPCDCTNLRRVAIHRLDPERHCAKDRPCPVREYLLK